MLCKAFTVDYFSGVHACSNYDFESQQFQNPPSWISIFCFENVKKAPTLISKSQKKPIGRNVTKCQFGKQNKLQSLVEHFVKTGLS